MNRPENLTLRVNGARHVVSASADTPLLYILRNDLTLNGPKFGCGLGECGACTVIIDGEATRSCITATGDVEARKILTLEGLGTPDKLHPVQQAFIEEQAAQCGYCINGMIMTAAAFLARTPHPSVQDIRDALAANLCRCGTHIEIVRAVARAAQAH